MQIFDWYTWVILPLIVFLARVIDVGLGTMRIIFISRGKKVLAPLLGFVEVFIWITIVLQIVRGAQNIATYFAYAAGFAVGNFIGMYLEDKLAIGTLVIRIILPIDGDSLIESLQAEGYGITHVQGNGVSGPVRLIYTVVLRKELSRVVNIIQSTHPKAFLTVAELRSVQQEIFPVRSSARPDMFFRRKSK